MLVPIGATLDRYGRSVQTYVDTDDLSDEDYAIYFDLKKIAENSKDTLEVSKAHREILKLLRSVT